MAPKSSEPIRYYTHDGMEKVESKHGLIIPIDMVDVLQGAPGNPQACAIAKGAERLYGCTRASVGVSRAEFDLLDPDGVRRIYVFLVPAATRKAIENFDRTGEIPLGGFRFSAVVPSHTRAYRKMVNDRRNLADYQPTKPRGPHPEPIELVASPPRQSAAPRQPTRNARSHRRGSSLVIEVA